MPYFVDTDLKNKLLVNQSNCLRTCQHAALLSVLAHFAASEEPAVISMPTGSGKTELMIACAFALRSRRALVVTPTEILRTQTATRATELTVFREHGLIEADAGPVVHELQHVRSTEALWRDLQAFDAVVAHPKTVSRAEKGVTSPPDGLFDLLLLDEAHHAAATTWRELILSFPNAKAVLFSATPFRRDRRKLPGRLVFHYPLGRALDDGIYRPLKFRPVAAPDPTTRDRCIADAAVAQLTSELQNNASAALLVRTDTIEASERLVQVYSDAGVEAVPIHSNLTKAEVGDRVAKLRSGAVRAVITVGMFAEGMDVPGLKVAALHATPRTLPFMLQLVGRVSRTPANQVGPAWLVAVPEVVRGEVRRLFCEDREWHRFIPELVNDAVRSAHGGRADTILGNDWKSAIIPDELEPYYSVAVYKFLDAAGKLHPGRLPLRPEKVKRLPTSVERIEHLPEPEAGCLVLHTTAAHAPPWGRNTTLQDIVNDLHIFFAPPGTQLLFVASTNPRIAKPCVEALSDQLEPIPPKHLHSALTDADPVAYAAVGLQNALGVTGRNPAYRMNLGSGAATSVRVSEGRSFGAGHAMGRMQSGEHRGVATRRRRLWALRRAALPKFLAWCKDISPSLANASPGLPGLEFLAQAVDVSEIFTETPLAVVCSERHFATPPEMVFVVQEAPIVGDTPPSFDITSYAAGVLQANLIFSTTAPPVQLSYMPTSVDGPWQVTDARRLAVHDAVTGEEWSLQEFLNLNPPIILMPSGGAITGDHAWKLIKDAPSLPSTMFRVQDWTGTDIRKESEAAGPGMMNVQERTVELLKSLYPASILVVDDGANEMADIVVVDTAGKFVGFVHCKYAGDDKHRVQIADFYELVVQAARSQTWVRMHGLINELIARLKRRKKSRIVHGTAAALTNCVADYRPNEWTFCAFMVQPGLKTKDLRDDKECHLYRALHVTREWLQQTECDLVVWGA